MDIDEYDEQDLFIVDFSQNIYDNTDEPDDDSDNFEEIQNEENIRGRGGNRGRGRGQGLKVKVKVKAKVGVEPEIVVVKGINCTIALFLWILTKLLFLLGII